MDWQYATPFESSEGNLFFLASLEPGRIEAVEESIRFEMITGYRELASTQPREKLLKWIESHVLSEVRRIADNDIE